jgi:hypothetical protein
MSDDQPIAADPAIAAPETAQAAELPIQTETAKEHAPMLDVHPAHHAASTWREFFIHIATIAIGLLLAVGLEQTVEYVHHRRELTEARRELAEEKRFNTEEFRQSAASFQEAGKYLANYLAMLRQSIKDPAAPLPPLIVPAGFVYCQYTAWTTAERDGALTLMPPEEQRGIDRMYVGLHALDDAETGAFTSIMQAGAVFGNSPRPLARSLDFTGGVDPRDLTPEQKKQLYNDLSHALANVEGVLVVQGVTVLFNPELGGGEAVSPGPMQTPPNYGTP